MYYIKNSCKISIASTAALLLFINVVFKHINNMKGKALYK